MPIEEPALCYASMAVAEMKPKNAVEFLRDIMQDLLVPELEALKAELESQRRESHTQFDALHTELKITNTGTTG